MGIFVTHVTVARPHLAKPVHEALRYNTSLVPYASDSRSREKGAQNEPRILSVNTESF